MSDQPDPSAKLERMGELGFEFRMEAVTQIFLLLEPVDTHLGSWQDMANKSKPAVLWTKLCNIISLSTCTAVTP